MLVSRPGIEPGPRQWNALSPNHWSAREVPTHSSLRSTAIELSFTLSSSIFFLVFLCFLPGEIIGFIIINNSLYILDMFFVRNIIRFYFLIQNGGSYLLTQTYSSLLFIFNFRYRYMKFIFHLLLCFLIVPSSLSSPSYYLCLDNLFLSHYYFLYASSKNKFLFFSIYAWNYKIFKIYNNLKLVDICTIL